MHRFVRDIGVKGERWGRSAPYIKSVHHAYDDEDAAPSNFGLDHLHRYSPSTGAVSASLPVRFTVSQVLRSAQQTKSAHPSKCRHLFEAASTALKNLSQCLFPNIRLN